MLVILVVLQLAMELAVAVAEEMLLRPLTQHQRVAQDRQEFYI
jgi:hypothetical protein